MSTHLASPAWLLRGISSLVGQLELRDGRLDFTVIASISAWPWQVRKLGRLAQAPDFAECLAAGRPALLFSEQIEALSICSPWYYFKGGMKVRTPRARYRLSFGAPADRAGVEVADLPAAVRQVRDMRRIGKRWLHVLAGAHATA